MKQQNFFLKPFPNHGKIPNIEIKGSILRNYNYLILNYQIEGDINNISINSPINNPTRKHELWEETCFEFFMGIADSSQYWEFNLAPSGNWNIYRFSDYRQGMTEELAFSSLPFKFETKNNSLSLNLELDLSLIISFNQAVEIGITTVIKDSNNELTYWALTHSKKEADFHQRESFVIIC